MMRSLMMTLSVAVLSASSAAFAGDGALFAQGASVIAQADSTGTKQKVDVSSNVSDDGRATTILFSNYVVDINAAHSDPVAAIKNVAVALPMKKGSAREFKGHLRGHVDAKSFDHHIVLHIGGKLHELKLESNERQNAATDGGYDFIAEIEGETVDHAYNTIACITVHLDRDTNKMGAGGSIQIDSLDLELEE